MSQITVERGGPTIWPWVMGLIVVAVLVWAFSELVVGAPDAQSVDTTDTTAVEAPRP